MNIDKNLQSVKQFFLIKFKKYIYIKTTVLKL